MRFVDHMEIGSKLRGELPLLLSANPPPIDLCHLQKEAPGAELGSAADLSAR